MAWHGEVHHRNDRKDSTMEKENSIEARRRESDRQAHEGRVAEMLRRLSQS